MHKTIVASTAVAVLLAGCATPPKDIAPAYVSTGLYENLNCDQLRSEAEGVSARAAAAFGKQNQNRGRDAAMTTVSLVLFWPAAFFLKGDGADAAEVARQELYRRWTRRTARRPVRRRHGGRPT